MIALGRKSEALTYFCEGLKNAVTEDDKFALSTQVVNTAMDLKGTVSLTYTFCESGVTLFCYFSTPDL